MTKEQVRKAVEDLIEQGKDPSVRKVRAQLGNHGSHTDLGDLIREILAERAKLNAIRTDMPQILREKVDLMAGDFWTAAQGFANQAVEDAERGAALRVATAENHAREMAEVADQLEGDLEQRRQAEDLASARARDAEAKISAMQKKLLAAAKRDKKRDAQFAKLLQRLDEALGRIS